MSNYELYNRVLEAMNEDEGTFNAAARNWVEEAESANFKDEEANDLFYAAKLACSAWRSKAINGRISKIRMINYVRQIAEKKLPNPYPEEVLVEKEETPAEEELRVLGVVGEDKFPVEEQKEEKKLFSKKRKR